MKLWAPAAAMLAAAVAGVIAVLVIAARPLPAVNTVALNDLRHRVEAGWGALDPAAFADVPGSFTVVAADGRVVLRHGSAPTDELAAATADAAVLGVDVGEARVGTVFHVDEARRGARDARSRTITRVAAGSIALVTLGGLALLAWVRARVLAPFARMRAFAARVAGGDLDTPLAMDRANAFGAFTESFDLMRSELAASHAREQALRVSKHTLVAQLSHDIRTPVASIAAVAELLAVDESRPARAERLGTIRAKATQIDDLVAELFEANRDELEALPVEVADHPADDLARLVTAADVGGVVRADPPPPCLVSYDERRMQQVVDNLLSNAAKYAASPVTVGWDRRGDVLRVTFADAGPGVPAGELDTVLGRGVRGSNVGDVPGQGLGLHTSAWLMERMGGALAVRNTGDGFAADVDVPLSR